MSRHINFQFMNRQLLWEHFTQLALCVVPLVDWDGLRRQVSGLIRQRRLMYVPVMCARCSFASFSLVASLSWYTRTALTSTPIITPTFTNRGGPGEGGGVPGAGGADGDMACVVCGEEEAHTPYVTDCGHIYCYYCLKMQCIQDDQFACPRCGEFFATSQRWVMGGSDDGWRDYGRVK